MKWELEQLKPALARASHKLIEAKDLLTHIDNITGDGDLGISMEKTGYSILGELEKDDDGIAGLLTRCAISINRDAPSTMGTLTSLSMMEAAKLMKGKPAFRDLDLLRIPERMCNIIMIRGRAQLGDKTVLDALIPFSEKIVVAYEECGDISHAIQQACITAEEAANCTRGKLARIGRAKWIGERSRDCPDGGAVVCAIVVNAMLARDIVINVPGIAENGSTPHSLLPG